MGLAAPHLHTEEAARELLEAKLWPSGPVCPHCGAIEKIYKLRSKWDSTHQLRAGVYKCGGCRKKFTVTVGTIFEGSHIPIHKWLLGAHLMCSSKKGMSALQLQRQLELKSYRSAWFMCYRIRWAMTQSTMREALETDQAIASLLRVKPTAAMPRPGAHRQKGIVTEANGDFGPVKSKKDLAKTAKRIVNE